MANQNPKAELEALKTAMFACIKDQQAVTVTETCLGTLSFTPIATQGGKIAAKVTIE